MAPATAPASAAPLPPLRQRLLAALPELLLGLHYLFALQGMYLPGAGPRLFVSLLQAELLAIVATAFMGVVALTPVRDAEQARGRRLLFHGILVFFLLVAPGFLAALLFVGVMAATNVGTLLIRHTPDAAAQLASRVGTRLLVLFACLNIAGMPARVEDWQPGTGTGTAGALYFLSLAALELHGFHARLARGWTTAIAPQRRPGPSPLSGDLQRAFRAISRGADGVQARLSRGRRR